MPMSWYWLYEIRKARRGLGDATSAFQCGDHQGALCHGDGGDAWACGILIVGNRIGSWRQSAFRYCPSIVDVRQRLMMMALSFVKASARATSMRRYWNRLMKMPASFMTIWSMPGGNVSNSWQCEAKVMPRWRSVSVSWVYFSSAIIESNFYWYALILRIGSPSIIGAAILVSSSYLLWLHAPCFINKTSSATTLLRREWPRLHRPHWGIDLKVKIWSPHLISWYRAWWLEMIKAISDTGWLYGRRWCDGSSDNGYNLVIDSVRGLWYHDFSGINALICVMSNFMRPASATMPNFPSIIKMAILESKYLLADICNITSVIFSWW